MFLHWRPLFVYVNTGRYWHVRNHQKSTIVYLLIYLISSPFYNEMPPIRTRKSRARPFTSPPDLLESTGHPKTPQRCGVIWAKLFSQKLGIPIPQSIVRDLTNVPERSQTRILSSNSTRTFHNRLNSRPNTRGQKRALTRSDTAAVGNYLNNNTVPLKDRGAP